MRDFCLHLFCQCKLVDPELAIAKATDVVITPEQIEFLLWQFSQPQEGETEDDYRRRIIKCFVYKV